VHGACQAVLEAHFRSFGFGAHIPPSRHRIALSQRAPHRSARPHALRQGETIKQSPGNVNGAKASRSHPRFQFRTGSARGSTRRAPHIPPSRHRIALSQRAPHRSARPHALRQGETIKQSPGNVNGAKASRSHPRFQFRTGSARGSTRRAPTRHGVNESGGRKWLSKEGLSRGGFRTRSLQRRVGSPRFQLQGGVGGWKEAVGRVVGRVGRVVGRVVGMAVGRNIFSWKAVGSATGYRSASPSPGWHDQ
jgi:hypothetical protein